MFRKSSIKPWKAYGIRRVTLRIKGEKQAIVLTLNQFQSLADEFRNWFNTQAYVVEPK